MRSFSTSFPGEGKKPEGMKERVVRYPGGVLREKYEKREGVRKKSGIGETLFGIIFVLWFIGSIVLMITCFNGEEKVGLGMAVFGQLFFGFGVMALCAKAILGLVFVVVGGALGVGGLLHHFGSEQLQMFLVETVLPTAMCSAFVLVGVGMIFITYKNHFLRKRRCTLPATAQSTYINQEIIRVTKGSGDNERTVPVLMWVSYFQYYFNGNYYYADCEAIPATKEKPSLGEYREILINPNNPEEYWSKSSGNFEMILLFVLGVVFALAGGAATYFITKGF